MNLMDGDSSSWTSTLFTAAFFIGGNLLWHYSNLRHKWFQDELGNDNSNDHSHVYKDDDYDDEEEVLEEWYFRRRLEHRLSFQNEDASVNNNLSNGHHGRKPSFEQEDDEDTRRCTFTAESKYSIDFYPKNRNWTHFETYKEEVRSHFKVKREEGRGAQATENDNNNSILVPVTGEHSAIWMSLEGDRAAARTDVPRNITGSSPASSYHRALSSSDGDDENSTDEDSQVSRDHFVWTDSEYRAYADSSRLPKKSLRGKMKKPPLLTILSERSVPLTTFVSSSQEPPSSGLSTPAFLSRSNSRQGSISGDEAEDEGETAMSTTSSLHFAPIAHRRTSSLNNPNNAPRPGAEVSQVQNIVGGVDDDNNNNNNLSGVFSGSTLLSEQSPKPQSLGPWSKAGGGAQACRSPSSTSRRSYLRTASAPLTQPKPSVSSQPRSLKRSDTFVSVAVSEHRANYNARIMPHKLILVRHGQSMGNVDETLYSTTADNSIPLTMLGWKQARAAGRRLKEIVNGSGDVHFIVSPYVRTVETFHGIASAWSDPDIEFSHISDRLQRRKAWYGKLVEAGLSWAEDPRIREQDFGNLQDPAKIKASKKERNQFGAFYYRFAHGESAADVFDRISTFLDSLWRSFDVHPSRYFVLVTHGIAIRVLLARYFRYTIDQFHLLSNPRNCEMIVLSHDGNGRLQMAGRHELETTYSSPADLDQVTLRYKYKKRLRVIPQEFVRKVKIRISYKEDEGLIG